MRVLLIIGLAALLPLAAEAQRWGGPARMMRPPARLRAAPMPRMVVRPGPAPMMRGAPLRPGFPPRAMTVAPQWRRFRSGHIGFGFNFGRGQYPFGVPPQNRCFSDAFFDPFYCTRRPTRFTSFAPFTSFVPVMSYPFYSAPLVYEDANYSSANAEAQQQLERANAQVSDLTSQIEQLREELEQIQEQKSSATAVAAPPPKPAEAAKEAPPIPTTLVFRDGRRSEVENYAIVGNTLWVFNQQLRKKIPITELDLKATQQANEDQGVDFPLPASGK